MKQRYVRHYCIECGRIIFPYRFGYVKCKRCFFKSNSSFTRPANKSFWSKLPYAIYNFLKGLVAVLFIVGILLLFYGSLFSSILQEVNLYVHNPSQIKEIPQNIKQDFVPEVNGGANPGFPYWTSKTMSYSFDSNNQCDTKETNNVKHAFDILHNETNGLLTYIETPNGGLVISCHNSYGTYGETGLATPWLYPDEHIDKATIDFYQLPLGAIGCETYPTLELHETLHTLGFEDDFSSNKNIMYFGKRGEYWNPCRKIDERIVECLKNIYSNGEAGLSCSGIPHKAYGVSGTYPLIQGQ